MPSDVHLEYHIWVRCMEALDGVQHMRLAYVPMRSLRARHEVTFNADQVAGACSLSFAHTCRCKQIVDGPSAAHAGTSNHGDFHRRGCRRRTFRGGEEAFAHGASSAFARSLDHERTRVNVNTTDAKPYGTVTARA